MSNITPEISVIMGVYNQLSAQQLDAAVKSILNQTFSNFEFIIYDDGSIEEVSQRIQKLEHMDQRIIVIGSDENKGLAFSLNRCIDQATGKYLARMDADDESLPDRLEKEYRFLETHPAYDWVGCNAYLFDDDGVWNKTSRPEHPKQSDHFSFSPYIHPTVMYRKKIFDETDGYSEAKEALRCEDYEFFFRMYTLGYRGYNMQEELFKYRVDRYRYHKRPFRERINEMIVRYRCFKEAKTFIPKGWLYVIRPVMAAFVPYRLLIWLKGRHA